MYNKKVLKIATDNLGKAKAPAVPKDIIIDPRGQWDHPGKITRIPSNTITMQGVGYPVLGVPDKGKPVMMKPNQNYTFPNAEYVDEYPQMQTGGQTYTYQGRPDSYYKKDVDGKWMIKNESTKGKYIPIDDPKGARSKILNAQAKPVVSNAKKPAAQTSANTSMYDDKYIQPAESTAVRNLYQPAIPEVIGSNIMEYRTKAAEKKEKAINKNIQDKNKKVKQFYKDYHESPRYNEMLQKSEPDNWTDYHLARKINLEGYEESLYPEPKVGVRYKQPASDPRTGGFSRTETGDITVLPQGFGVKGLLPHEWSHSTDRPMYLQNPLTGARFKSGLGRVIPKTDQLWIMKHRADDWYSSPEFKQQSAENKKADWRLKNDPSMQDFLKTKKDWYDYVGEATETRARLNDIRYQSKQRGIYDPFTEKVTPATFKKLLNTDFEKGKKEGFDALKQLKDVYTDEEIQWMLNNISKNQDQNQEEDIEQGVGKKGGSLKSKKYTRSILGKNEVFDENKLFKKMKNERKRIFHPRAKYYQEGGESDEFLELDLTPEEIEEYAKGGYIVEDISIPELSQKQNGGPTEGGEYTFAERPGSTYKYQNGQWLISNPTTKGSFVPIEDETGERSQTLTAGLNSGKTQQISRGPQAAPMLDVNPLISTEQKISAATKASPTRVNADNLNELISQKAEEDAEKQRRIDEYKRKQAEEKAKAEGIAAWYDEEKKRRDEEAALFGNNGVQASDATRVDTGYLSPLIGLAKREEQDKRVQEDRVFESQQKVLGKGYKNLYEYERDPMGAQWEQAQANEAAWLQSGAERPMVNTGEMGYYQGPQNTKKGWDPTTKKYYTETGIYDPKTKKWRPNPSYYKGSGAIQSVDEVWMAPIAIPAALEGITGLAALQLPGMAGISGATVGNLANAGFIAHGLTKLPETGGAWYDAYKSGTGNYRDAIEKTFWNSLDFLGAGELKSPLKLQAAASERVIAESPLQRFVGNTGATAESAARAAEIPSSRNITGGLQDLAIEDDMLSQYYKNKAMNELNGENIPRYVNDADSWYNSSTYDKYDEIDDLFSQSNQLPPPPSEITIPSTTSASDLARQERVRQLTSTPAADAVMNFRNQPGYIDLTRPPRLAGSQSSVDPIDDLVSNPFPGLRGERTATIPSLQRRTALRLNNAYVPGTNMTVAETIARQDNPLNAVNEVRRFLQDETITPTVARDLMEALRAEIRQMPISAKEKKFFVSEAKRISNAQKDLAYTGSSKTEEELLRAFTRNPPNENLIIDNYGYSIADLDRFTDAYESNTRIMNIAKNQLFDDVRYITEHGVPNPNLPAIDFRTGEVSPMLKKQTELHQAGLSKDVTKTVEETMYDYSKRNTTGTVGYSDVEDPIIHAVTNKKLIPETKDLDTLIKNYEEAVSKLADGPLRNNLSRQLEDYKGTKWLRTEYAAELKAQGLNPERIEKASIISNSDTQKNLIDPDGNVIGTLNGSQGLTYEGAKGFQIGSTGVNLKFHPYQVGKSHSQFKDWDEALAFLENSKLEEKLATVTSATDRANPVIVKHFKREAKKEAEGIVKQLQENNNNRWGEALYRGVHHGVKDTRGPVYTSQGFAETHLADPITKELIGRYRAKDYWNSQTKQMNDLGIPKAEFVNSPTHDPNVVNAFDRPHIIIRRKQGGVPSKLNKFIH